MYRKILHIGSFNIEEKLMGNLIIKKKNNRNLILSIYSPDMKILASC